MESLDFLSMLMNMEFAGYVAITFIIYAIREAVNIPNNKIPLVAIILGIGWAALEMKGFNHEVIVQGLQNALISVGIVAGVKYGKEKVDK